jgi:uncharacterized membrane protein
MAQGSSMDMSRLSTGEKIVLGSAGLYFVWAFLPIWYKLSVDLGPLGSVTDNKNGLTGVTLLAWILAIVALVEIIARGLMAMNFNMSIKPGLVHVVIAALALLLTVIGLVAQPTGYGVAWGLIVAIIITLVWVYGAYMMYSAPDTTMSPPADTSNGMTA